MVPSAVGAAHRKSREFARAAAKFGGSGRAAGAMSCARGILGYHFKRGGGELDLPGVFEPNG